MLKEEKEKKRKRWKRKDILLGTEQRNFQKRKSNIELKRIRQRRGK